jgi:hypothetical protein
MKKHCAVWLLASVLLVSSGICVGVTVAVGNAPGTDPFLDMVTTLKAAGPHPSLGDHANDLGRLVGTWDVEYTDFAKDGKAIHHIGEFIVVWRNEASSDGGKTWRLQGEDHMKRRAAAPSAQ